MKNLISIRGETRRATLPTHLEQTQRRRDSPALPVPTSPVCHVRHDTEVPRYGRQFSKGESREERGKEKFTYPYTEQLLLRNSTFAVFVDGPYILLSSIRSDWDEHPVQSISTVHQVLCKTCLPGLLSISTSATGISGAAAPT